jgi:hypothetical protein
MDGLRAVSQEASASSARRRLVLLGTAAGGLLAVGVVAVLLVRSRAAELSHRPASMGDARMASAPSAALSGAQRPPIGTGQVVAMPGGAFKMEPGATRVEPSGCDVPFLDSDPEVALPDMRRRCEAKEGRACSQLGFVCNETLWSNYPPGVLPSTQCKSETCALLRTSKKV